MTHLLHGVGAVICARGSFVHALRIVSGGRDERTRRYIHTEEVFYHGTANPWASDNSGNYGWWYAYAVV